MSRGASFSMARRTGRAQPLTEPARWSVPTLETASGCFETMRVYGGKIFRLPGHLERLYASAAFLGVVIPQTPTQLGRRLTEAIDRSGLREAVIRVALIPDSGADGSLIGRRIGTLSRRVVAPSIVVQPVQLPTPEQYRRGIRIAVVPTRKFPVSQIDPQAKFSARLGSIQAVMDAQLRGVDEALFLDSQTGSVTESTASNFGIIKDGEFLAAPCWLGLLAGITWLAVMELARELGIAVRETPLTRHDIYNADEAFLSSTIKEILAVSAIDGRQIGSGLPGPTTRRLHRAFRDLVNRELLLDGSGTATSHKRQAT